MGRPGRGRLGRVATTVAVMSAFVLAACNSDPAGVEFEVIEEVTFDPSLNIDLSAMTKLPEGVYIQDVVAGTGSELTAGDHAWLYYELRLRNGVPIDSNLYHFDFPATNTIEGWNIGLAGMMAGGARVMLIPPELGYGAQPVGGVPGAILIFRIELDSIT